LQRVGRDKAKLIKAQYALDLKFEILKSFEIQANNCNENDEHSK
jgi:hypothetical protein